MKTLAIAIPIHSFVDLITNSSSETFVTASDKTAETLEKLVDSLLDGTGKSCKDILRIEFVPAKDEYEPGKIVATALDPSSKDAARIINKLSDTFETTEICC